MSRVGPRAPVLTGFMPTRSLSDLIWLANTRHGPAGHWFARVTSDDADHDHLVDGEAAARYLLDHAVAIPDEAPTASDLEVLARIRETTRGLRDPGAGWSTELRDLLVRTRFVVDASGQIAAEGSGWDAFIGDLLLALIKLEDLRDRLRTCGNPQCRLIFLDLSKSQTRVWCDDAGCGNRIRLRRFRSRATVRDGRHSIPDPGGPSAEGAVPVEQPHHVHPPTPAPADHGRAGATPGRTPATRGPT